MSEDTNSRVFAIVTTLDPTPAVADRVNSITNQVTSTVVVIDDCTPLKLDVLEMTAARNVQLLPMTENVGVAHAMNAGVSQSGARGTDLLLFLDDDTDLHSHYVVELLSALKGSSIDMARRIVGPSVIHIGDCCAVTNARDNQIWHADTQMPYQKKTGVISSGMLAQKAVFDAVGGFDDALFIDSVDYDFCLKAAVLGITTLQLRWIYIIHQLGCTTQRRILGFVFKTTNHSSVRRRYYVRNSCKVAWRYRARKPDYCMAVVVHHVKTIFLILTFEKDRLQKLKGMLYGYRDFLVGRVGKIEV